MQNNSKTIIVQQNETLHDVAIKNYGSIEGLFYILWDNDLDNVSRNYVGTPLKIRTDFYTNKRSKEMLENFQITTTWQL